MRYALSNLLVGEDDAVVIDPGWESNEGWRHVESGLGMAGIAVEELTGIVATHYHSDHLGMATRQREASGAWVAMGEHEVRRILRQVMTVASRRGPCPACALGRPGRLVG